MKSVIQDTKECFICRMLYGDSIELSPYGLEEHHMICGTANRKNSERYGLKVWLCPEHHRTGKQAVHRTKEYMNRLQMIAQRKFEETNSREEFRQIFGRSYL